MAQILVPGIEHRLHTGKSTRLLDPRWITIHTMAGTLEGSIAWSAPAGRSYWHLGTGGDGRAVQTQDLRCRAAADLEANPYSISIENEDKGPRFKRWSGSDVPAFTDEQAETLVVLLSWLCHRFGLPRSAIRSTCLHERGIGWHRLGIDPWRQPGCLRTSASFAKACPGDRRIQQLTSEIIPAVSAPAPNEEEDVKPVLVRISGKNPWWVIDAFGRRHVKSVEEARGLISNDLVRHHNGGPFVWPAEHEHRLLAIPDLDEIRAFGPGDQMLAVNAIREALEGDNPVLRGPLKQIVRDVLSEPEPASDEG